MTSDVITLGRGEKKRNPLGGIKRCPDDVSGHFEWCAVSSERMGLRVLGLVFCLYTIATHISQVLEME